MSHIIILVLIALNILLYTFLPVDPGGQLLFSTVSILLAAQVVVDGEENHNE